MSTSPARPSVSEPAGRSPPVANQRAPCSPLTSHFRCGPSPRRAFTLLEVLVVVAIIALLVAILVPSLLNVREQTRRVACQANLRQLAYATHQYLMANAERFLHGQYTHITYGGKQGTRSMSDEGRDLRGPRPWNKYLNLPPITRGDRGMEVFHCPADHGSFIDEWPHDPVYSTHFDYFGNSYRANRFLIGPKPPELSPVDPCYNMVEGIRGRWDNFSSAEIFNDSKLLLTGDYPWDDWWNSSSSPDRLEWHLNPQQKAQSSWQNMTFMDGHTSFVEIQRGRYVTPQYIVIPFRGLQDDALACQQAVAQ